MRIMCYGLMLTALLAIAGCIPRAPFTWPDDSPAPVEQPVAAPERKHVPAVRPDQVSPENAAEKAQALEEELNGDYEAPLPTVGEAAPAPKK